MTRRCRWLSMTGAFLTGACLGLIARYLWPGGLDLSWAWVAYLAVGTTGAIWALAWLAVLANEKWRKP